MTSRCSFSKKLGRKNWTILHEWAGQELIPFLEWVRFFEKIQDYILFDEPRSEWFWINLFSKEKQNPFMNLTI